MFGAQGRSGARPLSMAHNVFMLMLMFVIMLMFIFNVGAHKSGSNGWDYIFPSLIV